MRSNSSANKAAAGKEKHYCSKHHFPCLGLVSRCQRVQIRKQQQECTAHRLDKEKATVVKTDKDRNPEDSYKFQAHRRFRPRILDHMLEDRE